MQKERKVVVGTNRERECQVGLVGMERERQVGLVGMKREGESQVGLVGMQRERKSRAQRESVA